MKLRILELCKNKGITQKALAEQIGLSAVGLSKAINGNPTLSTLEKIANALGVDIVELFEAKREGFTALIDHGGKLYRFDSIEALKGFISEVENNL